MKIINFSADSAKLGGGAHLAEEGKCVSFEATLSLSLLRQFSLMNKSSSPFFLSLSTPHSPLLTYTYTYIRSLNRPLLRLVRDSPLRLPFYRLH